MYIYGGTPCHTNWGLKTSYCILAVGKLPTSNPGPETGHSVIYFVFSVTLGIPQSP